MKEAHSLFLGYAVSHYTIFALSFNATILELPRKTKCFCGVEIVILSKFCLLVDLWTKTLDYWGCKNSSTCVPLGPSDENTIEFPTFVLQKPISWKILSSRRRWVMCYLAATITLRLQKGTAPVTSGTAYIWGVQRNMYPKGQFPLLFPFITPEILH